MKSFDTELKKYAEKVNLKVSERRELRERILAYMEYHPLKKQVSLREEIRGALPTESFITIPLGLNSYALRFIGSFVVFMLVLAPFAAEKSVPGEVLYIVKTGVNETIQGKLADSPYEKIQFETKLMERRIAEARALASEGKLTDDVKMQITEDFKGHTQAVQEGIDELRTQDAEGAAIATIAFNSSLDVQSAILDAESKSDSTTIASSSIDSLRTVVNEAREEAVTNAEQNESPSFEGLLAGVELETTRAYELFIVIKESATDEEIFDIDRRLSDINRLTSEAKEMHDKDVAKGGDELTTVLGFCQKLIAFMTDIDVRETVALEDIVPVVLSDEERILAVQTQVEALSVLRNKLSARMSSSTDIDFVTKAQGGLDEVASRTESALLVLKTGDIDSAESVVREAQAFIEDIQRMVESLTADGEVYPEPSLESGTTTEATDSESATSSSTPEVSFEGFEVNEG